MAYLIAPPLEAVVAVDAALKAAPVKLAKWIPPPSETNFAGAFLTGELHTSRPRATPSSRPSPPSRSLRSPPPAGLIACAAEEAPQAHLLCTRVGTRRRSAARQPAGSARSAHVHE